MADDQSNPTLTLSPAQRFGRRLREQREHHRITLDAIAASTKIKASLLAGLERGDVSDWPAGIFQRAFVREYARAIGLAPEPVVAEFVQLFVARNTAAENTGDGEPDGQLRLALAMEPPLVHPLFKQALAAASEAAGVAVVAAIASWMTAAGFGAACGILAFFYYPLSAAWLGSSPVAWYLRREQRPARADRGSEQAIPVPERRDRLYLVKPPADSERPSRATEEPGDLDSPLRRSAMR